MSFTIAPSSLPVLLQLTYILATVVQYKARQTQQNTDQTKQIITSVWHYSFLFHL